MSTKAMNSRQYAAKKKHMRNKFTNRSKETGSKVHPDGVNGMALYLYSEPGKPKPNGKVSMAGHWLIMGNCMKDRVGTPTQFFSGGTKSHHVKKTSHPGALWDLPCFVSKDNKKEGVEDDDIPVPGPTGMIKFKSDQQVVKAPSMFPVNVTDVSASRFQFFKEKQVKKKGEGDEDDKKSKKKDMLDDEDEGSDDEDPKAAKKRKREEEDDDKESRKVVYSMPKVGAIDPVPKIGARVDLAEILPFLIQAGLVPRYYTPPSREQEPTRDMQAWDDLVFAVPSGPGVKDFIKQFSKGVSFAYPSPFRITKKDSDDELYELTDINDPQKKKKNIAWRHSREIDQVDVEGRPDDVPTYMLLRITAYAEILYEFGITNRLSDRQRWAECLAQYLTYFTDGVFICTPDWSAIKKSTGERSNASAYQGDFMDDGLDAEMDGGGGGANDEEPMTPPWSLRARTFKGRLRDMVLKYGIPISGERAKEHYDINLGAHTDAEEQDPSKTLDEASMVDPVLFGHGMIPVSTCPSKVVKFLPDEKGKVEGATDKLRIEYRLLSPSFAKSVLGKKLSNAVSTIQKCKNPTEMGDLFVSQFTAAPEPFDDDKHPKLAKIVESCEEQKDEAKDDDTNCMVYVVLHNATTDKLDEDPFYSREAMMDCLHQIYDEPSNSKNGKTDKPTKSNKPPKPAEDDEEEEEEEPEPPKKKPQAKRKPSPEPEPEEEEEEEEEEEVAPPPKKKAKKPEPEPEDEEMEEEEEEEETPPPKPKAKPKAKRGKKQPASDYESSEEEE